MTPTATVIIPTYNYAHYIGAAIDSVLAADFPRADLEILVADDGSTDDTAAVVARYGDPVTYLRLPNRGKTAATRTAIAHARGRYIFNLDADDLYLPARVAAAVECFERNPALVHVAHPAQVWDVASDRRSAEPVPTAIVGRPLPGLEVLRCLYRRNLLFGGGSTFAARADVLRQLPLPDAVDMFTDEYLVLHTLRHGESMFLPAPLSVWRVHAQNFSGRAADPAAHQRRQTRWQHSQAATLASVLDTDFPRDLQALYQLRCLVSVLGQKEVTQTKTLADIATLWRHLLTAFPHWGRHTPRILAAYLVLNRSLPSPLIRALHRARHKLAPSPTGVYP
jgi:glycosyltransferase involved in cell wall biosynthesis